MTNWDGSIAIPSFLAGERLKASELANVSTLLTALTDDWTTWSPTLANLTVGSGTLTTEYKRLGKTVDWRFRFLYGSGSAVGTAPSFTLPVTPHASYSTPYFGMGAGMMLDSGTTTRQAVLSMNTLGTVVIEWLNATPAQATITSSAPWTWTTNDSIYLWGRYEAA